MGTITRKLQKKNPARKTALAPASHFSQLLKKTLHELVEAPSEPTSTQTPIEEIAEQETVPFSSEKIEEEPEEKPASTQESTEILQTLNSATTHWKETGTFTVDLTPPLPFREKVKNTLHHISAKLPPLYSLVNRCTTLTKTLALRARTRLKTPQNEPLAQKNVESIDIATAWNQLEQLSSSQTNDRKEIDSLYTQLKKQTL